MKTQSEFLPRTRSKYCDEYWAHQFIRLGDAELAKQFPAMTKNIRRQTKMVLAFMTLCLLVAVWSVMVTDDVLINLF